MTIEKNKAAREAASVIHSLMMDEASNHTGTAALAFYRGILKDLRAVVPEELWPACTIERDPPMTDDEARAFERKTIGFGKYSDSLIGDIPIEYLVWLDEQPDFRRQLNAYLRSKLGQQAQEECRGGPKRCESR